MPFVTLPEIEAAQQRIKGVALRTPLVHWPGSADKEALYLKAESLQPIGSFKLRGAYNMIAQLSPEECKRGVIAHSSGNHAQGVAYAARARGVKATIVLPSTAPKIKVDATRALGAEIVISGPNSADRIKQSEALAAKHGYVMIPPYNHEHIIAGTGTIGLEILEDLPEPDAVVSPYGGGGLVSGVASAMRARSPRTRVYAVEPDTAAALNAALAAGEPTEVEYTPSFVDGSGSRHVLDAMWPRVRELIDGAFAVTLDETAAAVRLLAERTRVVAEGAGALSVAAALAGKAGEGRVVCIVSGGNIDTATLACILEGRLP